MRACATSTLCVLLVVPGWLLAMPADAQTTPAVDAAKADAVGASLSEMLAFATFGMVSTQAHPAQVSRSGSDYLVRLPLKGLSTPDDAAVKAVARPLDDGAWAITSLTFPSAGTFDVTGLKPGAGQIAYSIGEQSIHLEVDPGFAHPSSFAADLGAVVLRSERDGQRSEQALDRYIMDGKLSAEASGQLDFLSHGTGTNWHVIAHSPNGGMNETVVRLLAGRASVNGLDQAQGSKLIAAVRGLAGDPQSRLPGQPFSLSAAQHEQLHAVVDALAGLLGNFEADETLDGIRFSGSGGSGTIGRVRVDMNGSAANDRLGGRMDVAVDDLAVSGLLTEPAVYVPHHIGIRSVLAGVPTDRLMALLRAAIERNADPALLQAGLQALFADPQARAGIEAVTFDSGPMQVTGSARIVPRADGQLGAEIHVSATGMDALIAQAEAKPAMQRALPLMFMAKGMGRPDGGGLAWDIVVGDGPVRVNGVPFGQPAARTR